MFLSITMVYCSLSRSGVIAINYMPKLCAGLPVLAPKESKVSGQPRLIFDLNCLQSEMGEDLLSK